jgi:hypothetical protein
MKGIAMRRKLDGDPARDAGISARRHASKTLREQFGAASRRADQRASDLLSILEDEIAECDAFEHAFRAQHERFGADDGW